MEKFHIKVNLPYNKSGYESGNGEGVWVLVDFETKAAHDNNEVTADPSYHGILDNDSVYYPKLKCGAELYFEMRGNMRPVVPLDFLNDKGRITEQELNELKRKLMERYHGEYLKGAEHE